MSKRKKSPGWKKSQTTPTSKAVKSDASIDHIGARLKHLLDQLKAQAVHQRRVLEEAGIGAPAWDSGLDEALASVGLLPRPGFSSGVQARLERSVGAALANRGVLLTVGNVPIDGDRLKGREWRVMPGEEWSPAMKQDRKWRSKHRDANYNSRDRLDLAMEAQYCRLPPWLAMVVKSRMADHPEKAGEMMVGLGKLFGERYGVDVVGLGLHSENVHDWHIHILFSRSLERITGKSAGRKGRVEKTRLNGIIRAELKAAGKPATPKAVAAALGVAVAAKRFPDPQAATKKIEYVRRQEKISAAEPRTWGPAYRNKFWIYSAAADLDRDRVAGSSDRPVGDPGGFRWWLEGLAVVGNSPEEHFSDVWTEGQWQEICRGILDPQELKTVDDLRKKCVENYLELQTSMPTPIEAVAAHLQRERKKVLELEKEIAARDQGVPLLKEIADRERLKRQLVTVEAENARLKGLRERAQKLAEKLLEETEALKAEERRRVKEAAEQRTVEAESLQRAMSAIPEDLRGKRAEETISCLGKEVGALRRVAKLARELVETVSREGISSKGLTKLWKGLQKLATEVGCILPAKPTEKGLEPN